MTPIRCWQCDGWRGYPCGAFCEAIGGARTEAYPHGLTRPERPAKPTDDYMARRRLRQRLERKRPLFAADEYAAEVAARPGYYGRTLTEP